MPSKKQRSKAKKSQAPPKQEVVRIYAGYHIGSGFQHDADGNEIKMTTIVKTEGGGGGGSQNKNKTIYTEFPCEIE